MNPFNYGEGYANSLWLNLLSTQIDPNIMAAYNQLQTLIRNSPVSNEAVAALLLHSSSFQQPPIQQASLSLTEHGLFPHGSVGNATIERGDTAIPSVSLLNNNLQVHDVSTNLGSQSLLRNPFLPFPFNSDLIISNNCLETSRNEMMDFFSRAYEALDKKSADNGVVIKSKTSQTQGERNEDTGAILPTPPNTPAIDNNHPQFSEGGVQVGDIEEFALMFKNARIRFGFTQGDVGKHIGERFGSEFSQTTISRFEALNLSFKNMIKLRPQLTIWLTETEKFLKLGKTADEINNEKMHLMSNSAVSEEIKFEEIGMESPIERKRTYEDDPNGSIKKRRKRTNLEKFQRDHLTALFNLNQRPDEDQLENIATGLGLEVAVCRVWFCNRRQKERRNCASN